MAFREIDDVHQSDPALKRRWFQGDGIDVVVDQSDESARRLSITYTWNNQLMQLFHSGEQLHNNVLDDGESRPGRMKATPIAEQDAPIPADWLTQHFHDGDGLPRWLSEHICALLADH